MSHSATPEIPAIYETQKFLLRKWLFSKIHISLIHPSVNTL
jgi:hypothetical protein